MSEKMIEVEVRSAFMLEGKIQTKGSAAEPNVIAVPYAEARKLLYREKVVLASGGSLDDEEPEKDDKKEPVKKGGGKKAKADDADAPVAKAEGEAGAD